MKFCWQNCGWKMIQLQKNYLRMTLENFEEIFQLIKDDTGKKNTIVR